MRILFIADELESSSGSAHKVVAMATEWERRGHAVWLTTVREPIARRVSDVVPLLRTPPRARSFIDRAAGEASVRLLYPGTFQRVCSRLGIDLIYSRGLPFAPGLRRMIARIPFVVEINGDVAVEITDPWRRRSRLRARAIQLAHADGVVFISRELSRVCKPEPKRSIVIANPCVPSSTTVTAAPRPERPTLVMIGHTRHDWSGIDKIPELAAALPDLEFVLIGAELRGPTNLKSFPVLPQAEADRIMSACTVGIGQLARYRRGMHEASPLKSRNYLSLGLPIIQAYEDTDVSEADGIVLELPNREDGVRQNIERIREFAWRAFRDPSLSERALSLARGRLSLQAKEGERLAFIEECLRAREASRGLAAVS